jgi:hypothetical protein
MVEDPVNIKIFGVEFQIKTPVMELFFVFYNRIKLIAKFA